MTEHEEAWADFIQKYTDHEVKRGNHGFRISGIIFYNGDRPKAGMRVRLPDALPDLDGPLPIVLEPGLEIRRCTAPATPTKPLYLCRTLEGGA